MVSMQLDAQVSVEQLYRVHPSNFHLILDFDRLILLLTWYFSPLFKVKRECKNKCALLFQQFCFLKCDAVLLCLRIKCSQRTKKIQEEDSNNNYRNEGLKKNDVLFYWKYAVGGEEENSFHYAHEVSHMERVMVYG
jgi:hypothetical protein